MNLQQEILDELAAIKDGFKNARESDGYDLANETYHLDNAIRLVKELPISDVVGSFCCKECKHILPLTFQIKTEGYCYLCDPNVTLDECLSDAPLTK